MSSKDSEILNNKISTLWDFNNKKYKQIKNITKYVTPTIIFKLKEFIFINYF